MSRDFRIEPITPDTIRQLREDRGMGMYEARIAARQDNLERAIHNAKDLEDIKTCLLGLLNLKGDA